MSVVDEIDGGLSLLFVVFGLVVLGGGVYTAIVAAWKMVVFLMG